MFGAGSQMILAANQLESWSKRLRPSKQLETPSNWLRASNQLETPSKQLDRPKRLDTIPNNWTLQTIGDSSKCLEWPKSLEPSPVDFYFI